ncbi:LSU ribosomal protein LX [Staphylothermus marinus F1]|uniref:Large ribosomal subunit protein eL20 n=1 Tax=Staphylothermus marinus (strain ATCC 43588 / DSM 3639 / JCM 9404 / F1) TaxID=399550 RepID=RL18A_STAMF|nr:50S ribosomal protein L18Ae [Staphylothermus marinus]A3DNH6.1 RecName: Full=Large ribosomal subunit protein eL20; AltName: Full=50S ribosomal protein L18Ae; AltName: Full=50S ribosomal protein L20e; AltName: Full=50S ribosomal protein LX [Staphylothermus marinus F1]ABN70186.1 LSU ribosomal protein LX [Staphylothermus marinus F1]
MSEIKIYRVEGVMLLSHDRFPVWQKFTKEVRALNKEQAIEYVYSVLGSNHKLRRKHIRITKIEEITLSEVRDRRIVALARLERFVKL